MRKDNPKHRWHVTSEERDKIRRLTKQGVRQSVIARILHIGAPSVSKVQRAMGLPTRMVWPEKKILSLFERGWGGYKIAKYLRTPVNQVYLIAHKHNFRRPDGFGYPTDPEHEAKFIAAVKNREGYIKHLAKKYGIGICKAQRLARQVLATPRFRPGAVSPPLSSDFPQRHFDAKLARPEQFVELVQRITDKCFNGILPTTTDGEFAEAMMAGFRSTTLEGQPGPVLDAFYAGLVSAVGTLRMAEQARWHN